MQPAGFQNAEGILSAAYTLQGEDPAMANDPAYREFNAFIDRYAPSASKASGTSIVQGRIRTTPNSEIGSSGHWCQ